MNERDARALAVGRLVVELVEALGLRAPGAPAVYTTLALPPDVASLDAFQRLHRQQVGAGVVGWSKAGSVRSVTAEAWQAYLNEQTRAARSRRKRLPPSQMKSSADQFAEELGAALGIRILEPQ